MKWRVRLFDLQSPGFERESIFAMVALENLTRIEWNRTSTTTNFFPRPLPCSWLSSDIKAVKILNIPKSNKCTPSIYTVCFSFSLFCAFFSSSSVVLLWLVFSILLLLVLSLPFQAVVDLHERARGSDYIQSDHFHIHKNTIIFFWPSKNIQIG